jgi:hypothetical protein
MPVLPVIRAAASISVRAQAIALREGGAGTRRSARNGDHACGLGERWVPLRSEAANTLRSATPGDVRMALRLVFRQRQSLRTTFTVDEARDILDSRRHYYSVPPLFRFAARLFPPSPFDLATKRRPDGPPQF